MLKALLKKFCKAFMMTKAKTNEWYTTIPCKNWQDYVSEQKKLKNKFPVTNSILYRGEIDYGENKELKSSFDRAFETATPCKSPDIDKWLYEAAIIREFKRKAHHYISQPPHNSDFLEWLALMRHHGAPTRLLDFTYSHYIAAYFAFEKLTKEKRIIWAIDNGWLDKKSREYCIAIFKSISEKDNLDDPKFFVKCFLDPSQEHSCFVAPVNAGRMNRRLTIQQGLFLCPGNIEHTFKENLKSMRHNNSQKHVFKFVIPHSARNKALIELKHMNISRATLFPDLDGFAMSLNDRFEHFYCDFDIPIQTLRKMYEQANDIKSI